MSTDDEKKPPDVWTVYKTQVAAHTARFRAAYRNAVAENQEFPFIVDVRDAPSSGVPLGSYEEAICVFDEWLLGVTKDAAGNRLTASAFDVGDKQRVYVYVQ